MDFLSDVLDLLIFIFYLVLFTWLVNRIRFFRNTGWNVWLIPGLFILKVSAGIFYGWFFTKIPDYRINADTWRIYYSSLAERDWLLRDPLGFFGDLFQPRYSGETDVLATSNSFWNDVKEVLLVKLAAIFNLFSGGRYFVNVVFFEFLAFFGPVALARVWLKYYPRAKWPVIIGCFLFPSVLVWTSGFHKEGLLLTSLGMIVWTIWRLVKEPRLPNPASKNASLKKLSGILLILFHLFLLFLLRNYIAAAMLLAIVAWVLSEFRPRYRWLFFIGIYIAAGALFFISPLISARTNLPRVLVNRRMEFLGLKGESLLPMDSLAPTVQGYAQSLPEAVNHAALRPYPWQLKKAAYAPAAFEIVIFTVLVFIVLAGILRRQAAPKIPAFILFNIFFASSVLLVIGYTIPFIAAIVRYRAIILPFLATPLLINAWYYFDRKKI